jgi:hypothetical protein
MIKRWWESYKRYVAWEWEIWDRVWLAVKRWWRSTWRRR